MKNKNIMEKIIKDKKMSLFFSIIFIFLLFIIVYVIVNNNKQKNSLSMEDRQEIIRAGNFVASSLRFIDDSDIVLGKKNSKVSVIVYEDLSDYYSVKFDETLDLIFEEFKNNIIVAFRPYISEKSSVSNSLNLFAYCANKQNKFFETRKIILNFNKNDFLFEEDFFEFLKELDLEEESFNLCMNSNESFEVLLGLKKEAENFDVYGVPTIFVNQEMIVGSRKFEDIINLEGEKIEGMKNIIIRNLNK